MIDGEPPGSVGDGTDDGAADDGPADDGAADDGPADDGPADGDEDGTEGEAHAATSAAIITSDPRSRLTRRL
ncbi:MAG: hypothetical protein QOH61_2520 [Chloroflexota bacterium]|nr:hypothetical protein [Chloroflexota bacterium]